MTKELLDKLTKEIKELEYELTVTLPKEIAKAAAQGDLSENAEYEAALEKQRLLQTKLMNLKKRRAEIAQIDLSRIPKDRISYGTTVVLYDLDKDEEITYTLVMPEETEEGTDKISITSPIGKALVGKKEGDEVTVRVPSGERNFEIVEITTLHDKS